MCSLLSELKLRKCWFEFEMSVLRKFCRVPECRTSFTRNMSRVAHEERRHLCEDCSRLFLIIRDHVCPLKGQRLADRGPRNLNLGPFHERDSAHLGVLKLYSYVPRTKFEDLHDFYNTVDIPLNRLLTQVVRHWQGVRIQMALHVLLVNPFTEEEKSSFLAADCITVPSVHRVELAVIESAVQHIEILNQIVDRGSLWALDHVIRLDISVAQYNPLRIGCYFQMPRYLRSRQGIASIQSPRDSCFLYAVAACIKKVKGRSKHSAKQYHEIVKSLITSGLSEPVLLEEIPQFEQMNNVKIHVHAIEEEDEFKRNFPFRVSRHELAQGGHVIDLLLIGPPKSVHHWIAIVDFNAFMAKFSGSITGKHYCRACYNRFGTQAILSKHTELCLLQRPQVIEFPDPAKPWACYDNFKKYYATLPFSFVGVWDMECYLQPYSYCAKSSVPSTRIENMHVPFSYSLIVYGPDLKVFRRMTYVGPDVVGHFIRTAKIYADEVLAVLKINNEPILTPEEHIEFDAARRCQLCSARFTAARPKCFHHHHTKYFERVDAGGLARQSNYLSAICSFCNLQIQEKKRLTLVAHNGSRYDWKMLIRFMDEDVQDEIKVLAKNSETFYQLLIGNNLRMIDSFRHMSCSLDSLAKDLRAEGLDKFIITKQEFGKYGPDVLEILTSKLPFPYRFMTGPEALEHVGWCSRHYFDNDLKEARITDEEWGLVKKIWRLTGCKTMGDYSTIYLLLDTTLLADVLINYCNSSYELFGLEPLHFVSIPGYAKACMRYHTRDTKLQFFLDPDQMLHTLPSIRGGIQSLVRRLKRANVPGSDSFDASKPGSEICVLDVNQLYPSTFNQKLPVGKFRTLTQIELDRIFNGGQVDLSGYGGKWGCFLCVDLRFPKNSAWENKYKDFCFAPSKRFLTHADVLASHKNPSFDYAEHELYTLDSYLKQSRLIMSFYSKRGYMLHFEELILYLKHGVIVEGISYGYSFEQKDFMAKFLDRVTECRRNCDLETRVKILKNLMVSIYGKFIENVFMLEVIKISRDSPTALRLLALPEFKSAYIVHNKMSIFSMARPRIKYRQLIAIGASILAFSKIHMWNIYYDKLRPILCNRMQLLYQDTDSFIVFIEYLPGEVSLQKDFKALHAIMDCSNLHPDDPCYNVEHKAVPGLLKNELKSRKGVAFAAYQMKKYVLMIFDQYSGKGSKKVASAGANKYHLERMDFEKFVDGLTSHGCESITETRIRSVRQEVFTVRVTKVLLQNLYLHRRLLKDGIETRPWGMASED